MRRVGNPGCTSPRCPGAVIALLTILAAAAVPMSPGRADAVCASGLFGATGSNGVKGNFYCIEPTTGVGTLIGPLLDLSAHAYGITGLAFQPSTGVLFGSTTTQSPTAPGHLVRIDPTTATVTDVGPFNIGTFSGKPNSMSDITFDPTSGILYGNSGRTGNFYTITLATGTATSLGATGLMGGTSGGGLASNAAGTVFGSPTGAADDLFTYNKATGVATSVAMLSGAPFPGGNINALAFNGGGTLFGINNNEDDPSLTHLFTMNTTTGVITDVGASVDDLDAIAFQSTNAAFVPVPAISQWGQLLMAGLLVATGSWWVRRRTTSP